MANIVAVVGRPNVGKSTFFNRMIGERSAIMDNESGITRDRHYGHSDWGGKYFSVIDTGGYVLNSDDIFEEAIRSQVGLAIDEASVILFMVDSHAGVTDLDKEFAHILRRTKKPVIVIVNKADNTVDALSAPEFYALGFDKIFAVSSQSGSGTGDLLDEIITHFEEEGAEDPYEGIPKVAILGRPNVGKSSFLNMIVGKERSIVTEIAGTTRDAINSHYKQYGKEFIFVDTAGVRKKKNVTEDVEFYSVMRSLNALENSDVCILMIDATRGLESQDLNLFRLAHKNKKGIVILVNKWDLIEKDGKTHQTVETEMRKALAPHNYVPILFISVLTKQRIFQALEKTFEVYENRTKKIPTSELNEVMLKEIEKYPPPAHKGKYIRIKYVTQLPTHTPTIAFFCNLPQYIEEPYMRYLENKMRIHFPFDGVPIKLVFRKK